METIMALRIFTPFFVDSSLLRCRISEALPFTAIASKQSRSARWMCMVDEIKSEWWCCVSVSSRSNPRVSWS